MLACGRNGSVGEAVLADVPADATAIAQRLNEMLADSSHWGDLDSCPPSRGGLVAAGAFVGRLARCARRRVARRAANCGSFAGRARGELCWRLDDGRSRPLWACDTMSLMSYGAPIGDGSMLFVDEPGVMDGSTGLCGSCDSGAPSELRGLGVSNGADDAAETPEAYAVPFPGEGTFAEACKRYWEAR